MEIPLKPGPTVFPVCVTSTGVVGAASGVPSCCVWTFGPVGADCGVRCANAPGGEKKKSNKMNAAANCTVACVSLIRAPLRFCEIELNDSCGDETSSLAHSMMAELRQRISIHFRTTRAAVILRECRQECAAACPPGSRRRLRHCRGQEAHRLDISFDRPSCVRRSARLHGYAPR